MCCFDQDLVTKNNHNRCLSFSFGFHALRKSYTLLASRLSFQPCATPRSPRAQRNRWRSMKSLRRQFQTLIASLPSLLNVGTLLLLLFYVYAIAGIAGPICTARNLVIAWDFFFESKIACGRPQPCPRSGVLGYPGLGSWLKTPGRPPVYVMFCYGPP